MTRPKMRYPILVGAGFLLCTISCAAQESSEFSSYGGVSSGARSGGTGMMGGGAFGKTMGGAMDLTRRGGFPPAGTHGRERVVPGGGSGTLPPLPGHKKEEKKSTMVIEMGPPISKQAATQTFSHGGAAGAIHQEVNKQSQSPRPTHEVVPNAYPDAPKK